MTRHRVAIVVFADVDAGHPSNASGLAEIAIREALTTGNRDLPAELPIPLKNVPATNTVRVVGVLDAGTAITNGYLLAAPTRRAWTYAGLDEEDTDG